MTTQFYDANMPHQASMQQQYKNVSIFYGYVLPNFAQRHIDITDWVGIILINS